MFGALDMATGDGASAYQLCAVWALGVLDSAHRRQKIAGDVLRIMAEDTIKARALLNSLFAYQYQGDERVDTSGTNAHVPPVQAIIRLIRLSYHEAH